MTGKTVDVLIVGAGPAGLVAAALLARRRLRVLVVERNPDFAREFRGEILQPRFHKAMADVGLHEHLAGYPHERVEAAHFYFGHEKAASLRLARLDPRTETTWWMTQPDLLAALDAHARGFDGYELWFDARLEQLDGSTAVVERAGVAATIEARVVIGADGRFSAVRRLGGFETRYDHHDVDVLWFALPRPTGYDQVFGFFLGLDHNYLVLPKHPDMLQCGLVARPGEYHELHRGGIDAVKRELAGAHPVFAKFADHLADFSAFTYLKGNRGCVSDWARDGVVLIGDAAHTCSPAGGIGVAIAVETASVAAGVIVDCFANDDFSRAALAEVQRARQRQIDQVHRIQGRARLFVQSPPPVRRIAQFVLRLAGRLGLLPLGARRLLTQRGRLPLYGLERGRLYPDELTIAEGLERYFARSGFDRGTYPARWVRLPFGPFKLYLPNIGPRRAVVPLHDVDHVLSEYEADWAGEMGITGYELGAGVGRYWFGWIINLQGIWLGLLLFPRTIFAGFVRGRRSGSVFRRYEYDERLLQRTVGEVRDALPTARKDGHAPGVGDHVAFAGMLGLSLLVHLPLLVPLAWLVLLLLRAA